MATLGNILATGRDPRTDPRSWDQPLGGAATMPAAGPAPAATPMPGGPSGAAADLASQLVQRQQAFAQGAAPSTAALEGASLGTLRPDANGNVQVPAGILSQILQKLGLGGVMQSGPGAPPAGGR